MAKKKAAKKGSLRGRAALINATIRQPVPPGWCVPNHPNPKKRCKSPKRRKR